MANTYKNKPSYETACRGKTMYISGFKAHVALRALGNRHRRSANQNKRTKLDVYRCPYGPHWHIGSTDS